MADIDPGVDSAAATPSLGAAVDLSASDSSEGAMCMIARPAWWLGLLHHWCIWAILRSWVLPLVGIHIGPALGSSTVFESLKSIQMTH
jgi:hypothetical protein